MQAIYPRYRIKSGDIQLNNIAHAKKKKEKGIKLPKGSASIYVGWLGAEIVTLFNSKQLRKFAKAMGVHPNDQFVTDADFVGGMASIVHGKDGYPCFTLFLPSGKRRVVIHECVHMVHMIFDSRGIPLTESNTEAIAYMTDHLCEVVFGLFDKKAGNA